jgi:hypothetical protein
MSSENRFREIMWMNIATSRPLADTDVLLFDRIVGSCRVGRLLVNVEDAYDRDFWQIDGRRMPLYPLDIEYPNRRITWWAYAPKPPDTNGGKT